VVRLVDVPFMTDKKGGVVRMVYFTDLTVII
jgi:hypothetical protein